MMNIIKSYNEAKYYCHAHDIGKLQIEISINCNLEIIDSDFILTNFNDQRIIVSEKSVKDWSDMTKDFMEDNEDCKEDIDEGSIKGIKIINTYL